MTGGPRARREANGHYHPEYWGKEDHFRFEDRVTSELEKLEKTVERLTNRVTLMLGGIGLVAFLLPIISPFLRALLGLDAPPGQ